ncbi:MAG: biotin/lipoyl-binding protein [Oscillospiraceae bacterium]|jgi:multidrug efflux pump subunit AcrA (membrane-fusion protein)|nr:biotin/lipoyl-binding protein [Oscillospiraceae bacterium]
MKANNRGWVKNIAIIFLAVLLALTFFSNTILNASLPEVSGQQAGGGEISTAVRGTGTVASNEAFSVSIDRTRRIKKVLVRQGDTVEAGQVLFELEPTDSNELKQAEATLADLRYQFNMKLLNIKPNDYRTDEVAIARLQESLNDAMTRRDEAIVAQSTLEVAKAADFAAQDKLAEANDEIALINEQINALNAPVDPSTLTGEVLRLYNVWQAAKETSKHALRAQEDAQAAVNNPTSVAEATQHMATMQEVVRGALNDSILVAAEDAVKATYVGEELALYEDFIAKKAELAGAFSSIISRELRAFLDYTPHTAPALVAAVTDVKNADAMFKAAQDALTIAQGDSSILPNAQEAYRKAQRAETDAKEAYDVAYEAENKELTAETAGKKSELNAKLSSKKKDLVAIQRAATDAQTALQKATQEANFTPEQAEDAIKSARRALEDKMLQLETAQDSAATTAAITDLELGKMRKQIEDQELEIARLKELEVGNDVTTRYGGTVLSVVSIAGDNTMPGVALATIEINGKGYTLSFTVTNEEAQRVRVGDIATINSWGANGVTCTLSAIKVDRDNPSRRKLLEFDVTGDGATAGQNLDLSIGSRTQYYDMIVPNSAVREDSTGSFVLIAQDKRTPLGTRYIATRVDVTVQNSDSKSTAVSGEFGWSAFVITTSSKPITPGSQVRLVG